MQNHVPPQMNKERRKELTAAYRERKILAGIFRLRCEATGRQWIGAAPDISTIWNRLSFTLRQGSATHASLQRAWREQGAHRFSFEILERHDAGELGILRDRTLRARRDHWCRLNGAEPI